MNKSTALSLIASLSLNEEQAELILASVVEETPSREGWLVREVNKDSGSLFIGDLAVVAKGDLIQIQDETAPRRITYVMGEGSRCHVCCKGTGPFDTGRITFKVIKAA